MATTLASPADFFSTELEGIEVGELPTDAALASLSSGWTAGSASWSGTGAGSCAIRGGRGPSG